MIKRGEAWNTRSTRSIFKSGGFILRDGVLRLLSHEVRASW
jgi:hypothetical protein